VAQRTSRSGLGVGPCRTLEDVGAGIGAAPAGSPHPCAPWLSGRGVRCDPCRATEFSNGDVVVGGLAARVARSQQHPRASLVLSGHAPSDPDVDQHPAGVVLRAPRPQPPVASLNAAVSPTRSASSASSTVPACDTQENACYTGDPVSATDGRSFPGCSPRPQVAALRAARGLALPDRPGISWLKGPPSNRGRAPAASR
jgi:hypothetical protein